MGQLEAGDISLRVRKVIAESLCVELEEVSTSALLIKDLGAESIDFLDIMFRLEKEFGIKGNSILEWSGKRPILKRPCNEN